METTSSHDVLFFEAILQVQDLKEEVLAAGLNKAKYNPRSSSSDFLIFNTSYLRYAQRAFMCLSC